LEFSKCVKYLPAPHFMQKLWLKSIILIRFGTFFGSKRERKIHLSLIGILFFLSLHLMFCSYIFFPEQSVSQPPSHTWIVGVSNLFPHKHIYFTVCAHLFTSSNCSVGILQRFEKHAHILIRELKKGIHFFQGNI